MKMFVGMTAPARTKMRLLAMVKMADLEAGTHQSRFMPTSAMAAQVAMLSWQREQLAALPIRTYRKVLCTHVCGKSCTMHSSIFFV